MFEGSAESIARQKSTIFRIARAFDGYSGGAEAGKRGYRLTFLIAYIRDFVLSWYAIPAVAPGDLAADCRCMCIVTSWRNRSKRPLNGRM